MIIRAIDRPATILLTARTAAPRDVLGVFGRVEVLQLTSSELHESFGITLADFDVVSPFELAAALTSRRGEATAANLRKDRLVRLIDRRAFMLPCFVGYQQVPRLGLLPFMTDGPQGQWSLFFEVDGRMTLVEGAGHTLKVTPDAELVGPMAAPVRVARSFLFRGRNAARPPAERHEEGRVIHIGARGDSRQPGRR